MDIERTIEFLQENKKELKDTTLVFDNYAVAFEIEVGSYVLSREISELKKTKIMLPVFKEKDWDIFLQKVKEEIAPKIIDKNINN